MGDESRAAAAQLDAPAAASSAELLASARKCLVSPDMVAALATSPLPPLQKSVAALKASQVGDAQARKSVEKCEKAVEEVKKAFLKLQEAKAAAAAAATVAQDTLAASRFRVGAVQPDAAVGLVPLGLSKKTTKK